MTKEEILKKLKYDTQIRGLSKNTQDEYYTKAKSFQDYYNKPATELDINDIKNYLYYLLTEKSFLLVQSTRITAVSDSYTT